MDALVQHVTAHWRAYVGLVVCSLPLIYVFRRQVTPVLVHSAEVALYAGALHLVLHGLVGAAGWFKMQSTMYVREQVNPGWTTPLGAFWRREAYNPGWLFYLELALLAGIMVLVYRYRPFRARRRRPPRKPPPHIQQLREKVMGGKRPS